MPRLAAADLTPVLNSLDQVDVAAVWAAAHGPRPAALHIDTGLSRLGVRVEEAQAIAAAPERLAGLDLVLVMSHLACAADPSHPMNEAQLTRFIEAASHYPGVPRSLANSGGIFLDRRYVFDVVRPGVTLYGGGPREAQDERFKAVAWLEAPILQVRDVLPGESVGYDASFTAHEPMRVAITPVGHADGYLRAAAGSAYAWLAGKRRPILGCVSMDLVAVDVTGCGEAKPGAMVELIGPHVLVDDLAAAAGTISYEILVRLSSRARRVYLGEV
jgi:alanine racemase